MKFSMGQQLSQASLLSLVVERSRLSYRVLNQFWKTEISLTQRLTLMMLVYPVYYLTFMTSIKSQNWTKINLGSIIKMHFIRVSKGKTSQCE